MAQQVRVQDTLEYQQRRAQIQKEINEDKVAIDKECFKKSTVEKLELKKRISEYKKSVKKK